MEKREKMEMEGEGKSEGWEESQDTGGEGGRERRGEDLRYRKN